MDIGFVLYVLMEIAGQSVWSVELAAFAPPYCIIIKSSTGTFVFFFFLLLSDFEEGGGTLPSLFPFCPFATNTRNTLCASPGIPREDPSKV